MPKGAKKGENRFKGTQDAGVELRIKHFEEYVVPKMKAMCDIVHFPNKTAFQKMCAKTFNESLPVNMKNITHRAIANNPRYWCIVGAVYHSYYRSDDSKPLDILKKDAVIKLGNIERIEGLEREKSSLKQENSALKAFIVKNDIQEKKPAQNTLISHEVVNDLIAIIDFLVKATEGVVDINKEERSITNLALDINSTLSKSISCTYFDVLEGKI
ncbi:hypothetical protein [Enterovibrio norvegicus]|uniref:hypothetical protein n=1 Tax=Enterovibrio norvegicus TaxID=188144 RepID=UPI00352DB3F5